MNHAIGHVASTRPDSQSLPFTSADLPRFFGPRTTVRSCRPVPRLPRRLPLGFPSFAGVSARGLSSSRPTPSVPASASSSRTLASSPTPPTAPRKHPLRSAPRRAPTPDDATGAQGPPSRAGRLRLGQARLEDSVRGGSTGLPWPWVTTFQASTLVNLGNRRASGPCGPPRRVAVSDSDQCSDTTPKPWCRLEPRCAPSARARVYPAQLGRVRALSARSQCLLAPCVCPYAQTHGGRSISDSSTPK